MAKRRDYYEVLGVSASASVEEIRKAFRREAAKHHPDRNQQDPVAEERFKEVNSAYQVLSDEEKRRTYDQFGFEGLEGPGEAGFTGVQDVFNNMGEIFRDMFTETFGTRIPPGRGARRGPAPPSTARKGQDLRVEYALTLRESIFGVSQILQLRTAVMCTDCEGSGARKGTQPQTCPACRGEGQVALPRGFVLFWQKCSQCHGVGRVVLHPCGACRGQGGIETERQVEVNFPPGIEHGQNVRVAGYGMPGVGGGLPGDLIVSVTVKADEQFVREGDDLVIGVHILFTEAMLGGDIKVPVLDASRPDATVTVQIPPGTQPGATIRMPGHGAHRWHHGKRGSLVVVLHVDLPAQLSERAKALVAELNAELRATMTHEHEQRTVVQQLDSLPLRSGGDELS
jgi:molecular chaperone DnaJ